MGGLYNALFGWDPACLLVAPMLTDKNPQEFFPRFRDCSIDSDTDEIFILTRVGGGNRDDYHDEIESLRAMPTYIEDFDDDFDCTYAMFVFGVPQEWDRDFCKIKDAKLDELSDAYIERIQGCYPSIDVREMLSRQEQTNE